MEKGKVIFENGSEKFLPSEAVMRQMAKLATEQATTFFANQARLFANSKGMETVTGREALEAFARAIESSNAKIWPVNQNGGPDA